MLHKLIILLALLAAVFVSAEAQDIIRLSDGTTKQVKVLEVNPTEIKYKNFTNPDGPTFTVPISSLISITYEDGTTDTFSTTPAAPATPQLQPYSGMIGGSESSNTDLLMDIQKHMNRASNWSKAKWIVSGTLIAGSIVMVIIGFKGYISYDWSSDHTPRKFRNDPLIGAGAGTFALGIGSYFLCNSMAKREENKAWEIQRMTVSEMTIFDNGSQNLSAGIDVIGNRYTQGIGLGLRYSF